MKVLKRNKQLERFNINKILKAVEAAYKSTNKEVDVDVMYELKCFPESLRGDVISVETIQDEVEKVLMDLAPYEVARAYIVYREEHKAIRKYAQDKINFINNYKKSDNTANATVDDNSNVSGKNIGILNSEIHKKDNIQISRRMVVEKLKELYPEFNAKQYIKDLDNHVIYKHDESSFSGAIAPYCCSISMYPFLTDGIRNIGGLSAAPKNIDSFCGMYVNLIFATSAMFAGAVATSEFLLYFTYFCKKEWGEEFYLKPDIVISTPLSYRKKTIRSQIHQYWQQVVYSINQPAAARGLQSAFVNFSYFDKAFFEGMFGDFYFPDGTKPDWPSLNWIQREFMQWFNQERLKTMLTFPVESFALVYKQGEFVDKDSAKFVAEEYARGHSFFTYISDTVDSLSSCCFAPETKVLWKSSTKGVQYTSLKELYDTKWEPDKKNLRIFHNGFWIPGKAIRTNNTNFYKVTTSNHKVFYMTDDHINVTLNGEKKTSSLQVGDYLMFNTQVLNAVPNLDEHLTYEMGFVIGAFLGDGSFGSEIQGTIYDINFSQNKEKVDLCISNINKCAEQLGIENRASLSKIYNNVYPVRISSKKLVAFIQKWTLWTKGTYAHNKKLNLDCLLQSVEFRKGILEGWYNTDGGNSNRCYTTSENLKDAMEVLITSLGMNTIIDCSDRTDEKVIIRNAEYTRNYPLWCVRWYEPCNKTNIPGIYKWKNNSQYFKIISIEHLGDCSEKQYSYCIECSDIENPYFTLPSGLITHNCRLKNMITTKEFNFTNGNMGIQTGSKSVITLNLNRIIQDYFGPCKHEEVVKKNYWNDTVTQEQFVVYLKSILSRVYRYHNAYNELLWDMYNSNLLPVYKAGFIDLNKQYLTIGLNGLNQAAEFVGLKCDDNEEYSKFCQLIFSTIKEENLKHKTKTTTYNTEQVPAESLAVKNYNWDKEDKYWVPEDTNLYASYIFKPNDPNVTALDKLKLHGSNYIGDYLDGGAACHINLNDHLSSKQYYKLLKYAVKVGCQYFTFNIPNSECEDCHYITKVPITKCHRCGSENISLWDRPIGYLSKIRNWSKGRQIEQKTRVYEREDNIKIS